MTNNPLPSLDMYKDVMTHNNARILSKLMPRRKVMEIIQRSTRENSRTPVQWSDAKYAGFSTAEPWFPINDNYHHVNVAAQEDDPDSLLNFYRRLLRFRRDNPVVLWGEYIEHVPEDKNFYVYERRYKGQRLLVICAFTDQQLRFNAPAHINLERWTLELSNYDYCFAIGNGFTIRPYEMRVYSLKK